MISASPKAAFRAWEKNALEMAYTPDMSEAIDTEEEILADELGCSIQIARKVLIKLREERENHAGSSRELFGRVISMLLQGHNNRPSLYGLACAGGLDQMNGIRSQAEAARENGGTRAIYSHYTTAWADYMSGKEWRLSITKYRKAEATRETFKLKATDPFLTSRKKSIEMRKQSTN